MYAINSFSLWLEDDKNYVVKKEGKGLRRLKILWQRNTLLQVGALVVGWMLCEVFVSLARVPIPGGMLGFFLLATCFLKRIVSPLWLKRGATSLLDHIMLFFVPAMVALTGRPELLGLLGLKLLLAVILGTVLVMVATALIVDIGFRRGEQRDS